MRGSVKSGLIGQLCNENRSGGLGKSSAEVSESTVDEDEESREKFGSWFKLGFVAGRDGIHVSVWSCAGGAADTREEAGARCAAAGPRL